MTRHQHLKGVVGKEGVTFFRGQGGIFTTNKVKSEIFNDKKVFKQKYFFSFINKNSNWEFLPKNFVTFNR